MRPEITQILSVIAKRELGIESLDGHYYTEVTVFTIREALEEAFRQGALFGSLMKEKGNDHV